MQKLTTPLPQDGSNGLSRYDTQRARTLRGLVFMAIAASLLSMPGMFIDDRLEALPVNFVFQLVMIVILWMQRRGQHVAAASMFTLSALLAVTGQTLRVGPATGIHFWYVPLIFLPAVIFPSKQGRLTVVASAASLVAYSLCVFWAEAAKHDGAVYVFAQLLSAVTIFVMSVVMRRATLTAEAESEHQRSLLEEQARNLLDSNKQLEHANRHKDEFLANMSHELRTPLSAILGLNEVMLGRVYGELNERQTDALRQMEASGVRLLELIDDVLMMSRIRTGSLQLSLSDVSIVRICEEVIEEVRPLAARKGLQVQLELSEGSVPEIPADPDGLRRVFSNLLGNAIKFTEAGEVGVSISGPEREFVRVEVWDTGIGISEQEFPGLFESFRQVDGSLSRPYEGSGLGLALVQQWVEAHGGTIRVQSALGEGSRFSVLLPMSARAHAPSVC